MTGFRLLMIVIFVAIVGYTAVVTSNHGFGLFGIFFGDIAAMGWPGQFNLDFTSMLTLSALWVAWRHQCSPAGLGLALLAFLGGGLFLSIYLFFTSLAAGNDVKRLLLGDARAAA